MAAELDFARHLQSPNGRQKDEFFELYEQARKATQEAQRQGDAQLKAAIEAAMLIPEKTGQCPSFPSTIHSAALESRCAQSSSLSLDKKDVLPILYQFLLRTSLMYVIFNSYGADSFTFIKVEVGLWIAVLFITMVIIPSQHSSWCQGYRGIFLLFASTFLWFGEMMAVLATYSHLTLDMAHLFSQCIFASLLHRVPFRSHLKARLFGFGLETVGTLAMVSKAHDAIPAMLYFSSSHVLGIAFAYMSEQQQCGNGFSQSLSCFAMDRICAAHSSHTTVPQACGQQARKRALGGFAGGFAGVSSLKCPYPPPNWIDPLPSFSFSSRKDTILLDDSCSSSSTVDNTVDCGLHH